MKHCALSISEITMNETSPVTLKKKFVAFHPKGRTGCIIMQKLLFLKQRNGKQ